MKILWLASWYPSKVDAFNGDFVQRQAMALSLYQPLTVIYTVKDTQNMFESYPHTEITVRGNLTEIIIYYRVNGGPFSLMTKMNSTLLFRKYFREAVFRWMRQKGRPDIVHLHVPYKAGLVALWLKRNLKIPFIITEHWAGYTKENPDSYFTRSLAFRKLLQKIFHSADAVVVLSENMRRSLKHLFDIHRTVLVPNVVNTDLFVHEKSSRKRKVRFIHVSSMVYQKNVEGLINTLARLKEVEKDWEIRMIGPASAAIVEQSQKLELDKFVRWLGEIPYPEVGVEMAHSDALLMFSRFENLPCVVLEALCCGVPVVSTDVGGIAEVINSSKGLLVTNDSSDEMLDALLFLMKNRDQFNREEIASDAKVRYSYSVIGKQIIDYYREILVDVN